MATRTVSVALVADVGNYVSAMTRASASTSAVGRNAQQAGTQASRGFDLAGKGGLLLAAGAAGAALGLKSAIGSASDLNETLNKSNVIFGDNAGKIERWAQNAARDFGLSRQAALEAAASFGNMFQQLGFTGEEAVRASTDVVKLAADLGSFNNLETGDVLERIQAAFRGEYDSLQLLIPNINAARVETEALATSGKENAKQLTAQEKAAAVLAIVNKDGAAAANDFAETSSGLANSTKIAAAEFEDLKSQIGQAFLPAAQAAMGFIGQTAIPVLGDLFRVVQDVSGAIVDNSEVALALAAVLAVQLAGGVTAVTIAFNRMILTPAVLGLSSVLGAVLNLPAAFAAARTAIGTFLTAAAPLVAVGAIVYGIAKTVEFATAAGDAREEIQDMWEAVDNSRGGEQVSALAGLVDQLTSKVRSLREELPQTEGAFQGFLGPLGMLENGGTIQALDEYEAALSRAQEQQRQVDRTAEAMAARFHLTGDQVLDLASKYNIDLTSGVSNVNRLFQNFYAQEFGAKPIEATYDFADSMAQAETATSEAKDAVDQFKLSLDILTGAQITTAQAQAAVYDAMAQATDAIKENGGAVLGNAGALNLQTENGRAALGVMVDLTNAANTEIATMIQQGATRDQVRARDAQLRQSFMDTLATMGITGQAAIDLTNKYYGIPAERQTKIDADTAAANAKVDEFQRNVDNTTGKTVTIQVRAAGRFIVNPQGGLQEFAEGGWTGPGSKFTPAGIVHAGEFVVPKEVVDRTGPGYWYHAAGMAQYANGGYVGPGYADGGFVRWGSVSQTEWNRLLAAGWKGRAGDNMEALYGPARLSVVHDTRHVDKAMAEVASAMKNAAPAAPKGLAGVPAGGGSLGGSYMSLFNAVKAAFPQARLNSGFRPGDPGYHGRGKAADIGLMGVPGGNGNAFMARVNQWLYDNHRGSLAELIYNGLGDSRANVKNSRNYAYSASTQAQHRNHVHAAVYDQGGPLHPGLTLAYNGTGRTEWVSREQSGSGSGGSVVREIHHHHAYDVDVTTSGDAVANARETARRLAKMERQALAGVR